MTIERRPRQFLAVWTDDGNAVKGSTFEESLYVDGQFWKNELTAVPPEKFGDFGSLFSTDLQKQHDALTAEKKAVDDQCAALQTQVDSLATKCDSLEADKSQLLADKLQLKESESALTTELNVVKSQVEMLTNQMPQHQQQSASQLTAVTANRDELAAQLAVATERISRLVEEIPFDPRAAKINAFRSRLFQVLDVADVVRLYAVDADPTLKQIAATITNWSEADPIRLDSPELCGPLDYLMSVNLLDAADVAFLRGDCTRQEAFCESGTA